MRVDLISGVYFSPTGNTQKVVNTIGTRIAGDYYKEIDLTMAADRGKERRFTNHELLIVGVPVYRGRIPEVMAEELKLGVADLSKLNVERVKM